MHIQFKKYQVYRALAYLLSRICLPIYTSGTRITRGIRKLSYYWPWFGRDITFNAGAHQQMAKAIDIYHVKISNKSTLGMSFNRLLNQNYPGIHYQFKF